jgi:Leucine-rich repeat (LRR) protein
MACFKTNNENIPTSSPVSKNESENTYLPPLFTDSLPPIVTNNPLIDLDIDEFRKEYTKLPSDYEIELGQEPYGLSPVLGARFLSKTITKKEAKQITNIYLDSDSSNPMSLKGLRFFPNTSSIYWEKSILRELKEIAYLSKLKEIVLVDCDVGLNDSTEELNGLSQQKQIDYIEIVSCDLANIEFLRDCNNFTNRSNIYLLNDSISDISPINHIKEIRTIDLSGNQITDIRPLANMEIFHELKLRSNPIKDISVLSTLKPRIKELWLGETQIKDISPLVNLTELTFLSLADNQITDLTPLVNLKKLKTLWIENNDIQDISVLFNLPALEDLNVEGNPINRSQIKQFKKKEKKKKFSFKY